MEYDLLNELGSEFWVNVIMSKRLFSDIVYDYSILGEAMGISKKHNYTGILADIAKTLTFAEVAKTLNHEGTSITGMELTNRLRVSEVYKRISHIFNDRKEHTRNLKKSMIMQSRAVLKLLIQHTCNKHSIGRCCELRFILDEDIYNDSRIYNDYYLADIQELRFSFVLRFSPNPVSKLIRFIPEQYIAIAEMEAEDEEKMPCLKHRGYDYMKYVSGVVWDKIDSCNPYCPILKNIEDIPNGISIRIIYKQPNVTPMLTCPYAEDTLLQAAERYNRYVTEMISTARAKRNDFIIDDRTH